MKKCPQCGTQYSDVTLSFCLQDGTPLVVLPQSDTPTVVLGDADTVVRGAGRWGESQVTHVAQQPQGQPRSNTALAVAGTAVGMLMLFGIIAIAAFIYMRSSGEVASNTNAKLPPASTPAANGNSRQPDMTPVATPSRTVDAPPGNVSMPPSTPSTDISAAKAEVSRRIESWKSQAEALNLNAYMSHYASTVDYYRRSGASIGFVRADKQRAFSSYSSIDVNLSNMSVDLDASGRDATVTFDKEWDFRGARSSSGKVRQLMKLTKIDGQWLITAEKDLRVYYTR